MEFSYIHSLFEQLVLFIQRKQTFDDLFLFFFLRKFTNCTRTYSTVINELVVIAEA